MVDSIGVDSFFKFIYHVTIGVTTDYLETQYPGTPFNYHLN